jgi:rubredoxin
MRQSNSAVRYIDIAVEELPGLTEAVKNSNLPKEIAGKIILMIATFEHLYRLIENKSASIGRLIRMIFGAATERAGNISGKAKESVKSVKTQADKPKGHGRNGASAYPGATIVHVKHESLSAGMACPHCSDGKLYEQKEPAPIMRFVGRPPIGASKYELEKFRCNLCGEVFQADLPEEAGQNKYDETVGAVIGVMKYGGGFPFNRIEQLQASAGIPMPCLFGKRA